MKDAIELSERIVRWRKFSDLTQAELAEAITKHRRSCGEREATCSPSAVAQWELGETEPTQTNMHAMCDAFGITLSQFWGRVPALKTRVA